MITKQNALAKIKIVEQSPLDTFVIHYSSESFIDKPDGYSLRISSIAIQNFGTGQTYSFSIHHTAEVEKVPRDEVESHYDQLERKMLDEFFGFVEKHKSCIFVHWNMRNSTYGFQAIYHRFRVLGGSPVVLDEGRLIDLAKTLKEIYGSNYIDHPRMSMLLERNKITKQSFLTGSEEGEAFKKKEYFRLHFSTLRKVESFSAIIQLIMEGKLRTNEHPLVSKVKDMHEHWLFQFVELILAIIGLTTVLLTILANTPP